MRPLADILGAKTRRNPEPPDRRTLAPVRRDSRPRGAGRYVPLTRRQAEDWIWALRKWERRQKRTQGRRNRAVGHVGLAVHEFLARHAARHAGRLDDLSYERIAAVIGHCRSAVVAACERLARFGWLSWFRQFSPTGDVGARGPQVEQAPNFFWLTLPAKALAAAGVRMGPPIPDDQAHRAAAAAGDRRAMAVADSPLGGSLDLLSAAIQRKQRETASGSHSVDPSRI